MWSCFSPLENRITRDIESDKGSFFRALSVFAPILIYYFVNFLVLKLFKYITRVMSGISVDMAEFIQANSTLLATIMSILAMLVAMACLIPEAMGEYPVISIKGKPYGRIIKCCILGFCLALSVNVVFGWLHISDSSAAYDQVAEHQLSLSLFWGILLYGIVSPLAEEVVFRVLVYNRLRRNYNLPMAMIIAPLLFGIYHMNYVQAIYATILGFVICWAYERYGSCIYPYIIHAAANIAVYIASTVGSVGRFVVSPLGFIIFTLISLIMIIFIATERRVS